MTAPITLTLSLAHSRAVRAEAAWNKIADRARLLLAAGGTAAEREACAVELQAAANEVHHATVALRAEMAR